MGRSERRFPDRWNRVAGFTPSPRKRPLRGLCVKAREVGNKVLYEYFRANKKGEPKQNNRGIIMAPLKREFLTK